MTVKELIEKLKDAPQDAEVILPYHEFVTEIIIDGNEVEIR